MSDWLTRDDIGRLAAGAAWDITTATVAPGERYALGRLHPFKVTRELDPQYLRRHDEP